MLLFCLVVCMNELRWHRWSLVYVHIYNRDVVYMYCSTDKGGLQALPWCVYLPCMSCSSIIYINTIISSLSLLKSVYTVPLSVAAAHCVHYPAMSCDAPPRVVCGSVSAQKIFQQFAIV